MLTDVDMQQLIVETHSTVATLVERSRAIDSKLTGVIARQDIANGSVADIQKEQYRQDGALSAFRWMLATLIAVTGVGAGVAGVVLALVAKG